MFYTPEINTASLPEPLSLIQQYHAQTCSLENIFKSNILFNKTPSLSYQPFFHFNIHRRAETEQWSDEDFA